MMLMSGVKKRFSTADRTSAPSSRFARRSVSAVNPLASEKTTHPGSRSMMAEPARPA